MGLFFSAVVFSIKLDLKKELFVWQKEKKAALLLRGVRGVGGDTLEFKWSGLSEAPSILHHVTAAFHRSLQPEMTTLICIPVGGSGMSLISARDADNMEPNNQLSTISLK